MLSLIFSHIYNCYMTSSFSSFVHVPTYFLEKYRISVFSALHRLKSYGVVSV